jgi:ssDNA-binding Zn-finger/Zn-ribbon topoisomerase 1
VKRAFIATFIVLLFVMPIYTKAHPGQTDERGGHTCRTNCKQWGLNYGEYHYHTPSVSERNNPQINYRNQPQPKNDNGWILWFVLGAGVFGWLFYQGNKTRGKNELQNINKSTYETNIIEDKKEYHVKKGNCEKCQVGNMIKKKGRYGYFYACSNFPKCRHTRSIKKRS